jgi:protease-4
MNQPWTDQQRRLVTNWMQQTYEQFTDRVTSRRGKKIKDIDEVAHGRIFLAKQARELGMVDEIGGLDKAIAGAAEKAKLKAGTYDVKAIPGTKTLGDLLRGEGPEARMPFKPQVQVHLESELLRTMAPGTRKLVLQQVSLLRQLQERPVLLATPYVLTVK